MSYTKRPKHSYVLNTYSRCVSISWSWCWIYLAEFARNKVTTSQFAFYITDQWWSNYDVYYLHTIHTSMNISYQGKTMIILYMLFHTYSELSSKKMKHEFKSFLPYQNLCIFHKRYFIKYLSLFSIILDLIHNNKVYQQCFI